MAFSDLFVFLEKSGRKIEIPFWVALFLMLTGVALGGISTSEMMGHPLFYMPGIYNLPTLASLLIVGASIFSSRMQSVLEHSIAAFVGRLSFPLYLFHLPIFCSFGCGFFVYLSTTGYSYFTAMIAASLLTLVFGIVVSWAAYYAVELPAIRSSGKFARLFHLPRPCDARTE